MPSRRDSWSLLVAASVLGAAACSCAYGQVPKEPPEASPIPLGPVALYPLLNVTAEYTDNLFYRSDDRPPKTATNIVSVSPGVFFHVPFSHSYAHFAYSPRFREYSTDAIDGNTSHFAFAESRLVFGNGVHVRFEDEYSRGVQDTQILSTELTFEGLDFEANAFVAEVGYERPGHSLLTGRYTGFRNRFLGEVEAQFFDITSYDVEIDGRRRFSRIGSLVWSVSYGEASYDTPAGSLQDLLERDRTFWIVDAGYRRQITPQNYIELRIGYTDDGFDRRDGTGRRTFRGVVGDVELARRFKGGATLQGSLVRNIYPSVYMDNAYYISDRIGLEFRSSSTSRLLYGTRAGYSLSDYPDPEPRREDRTLTGQVWAGFRFNPWMTWRIFLGKDDRSSLAPGVDFDVLSVGTAFVIGE